MLDRVTVSRESRTVTEVRNSEEQVPYDLVKSRLLADAVEIQIDQHFGIRITQGKDWTEISVREGGTWSSPRDTREVIRGLLGGR